jgi:hypothetical protein
VTAYCSFGPLAAAWACELAADLEELRCQLILALQEPLLEPLWLPPALALQWFNDDGTLRLEGVLAAHFIDVAVTCKDEVEPQLRAAGRPFDIVDIGEAALGARLLLGRAPVVSLAERWGFGVPSWWSKTTLIARVVAFLTDHPGLPDAEARKAAEKQEGPISAPQWRKARRLAPAEAKLPRGRPPISDKDN